MKLKIRTSIDAPSIAAWEFVADNFGTISEWTSLLRTSHLEGKTEVGGRRVCTALNGKLVTERLTKFDETGMSLSYTAEQENLGIIHSGENTWSVYSAGSRSSVLEMVPDIRLVWWALPLSPLVWLGMNLMLRRINDEVKFAIENGKQHPRKMKQENAT